MTAEEARNKAAAFNLKMSKEAQKKADEYLPILFKKIKGASDLGYFSITTTTTDEYGCIQINLKKIEQLGYKINSCTFYNYGLTISWES